MSSPWTKFPSSKGTPRGAESLQFTPRQSLNYGSFLDSSSAGRTQNRSASSAQVLEETPNHRVETFGLTLPVQIREALASRDRQTSQYASSKIDQSGWAWLVCGRKLFIWRYIPTMGAKSLYCKELTLPPTDLYHSANLVAILPSAMGGDSNSAASVAVMAASPEGVVRYWPSLAHDSSSIEMTTDLVGRHCHSLTAFQHCGCILMTTTNELMLLMPSQKTISLCTLKASGGVLSSLGRKMTSLIFGAQPASDLSASIHKVLVSNVVTDNSRIFYVLSGNQLFKWEVQMTSATSIQEKLLYQCDCESMFRAATEHSLQIPVETVDQVTVWCLDVCNFRSGIIILTAVALKGPSRTHLFYLLGTLNGEKAEAPTALESVNVVEFGEDYSASREQHLLDYKLLLPEQSVKAFVYSAHVVICVPAYKADDVVNKVDFKSPGDGILGAGVMDDKALFFSRRHGILNVMATEDDMSSQPTETPTARSIDVSQRTMPDIYVSEEFTSGESNDQMSLFKSAFLQFCQQNIDEAQSLCDKLFLSGETGLDSAVAALSEELIDDYPASDPRWAESIPAGSISTSSSLIILHQLEDKLKAHEFLVNFLKGVGLWDRIKTVNIRDQPFPTWCLLCEHAEKINAAIALCRCLKRYQSIVDDVIRIVVKKRGTSAPYKALTDQDLFFRQVSQIADVFVGFMEYEEEVLKVHMSKDAHVQAVAGINTLLQEMLQEAWHFRQDSSTTYQVTPDGTRQNVELMFWTATSGPTGLRSILLKQLQITAERGIGGTEDQKVRSVLFQQMVNLADILLDGYVNQLESLKYCPDKRDRYDEVNQKYEQDRRTAIFPLALLGQFSQATSLAEKYQDFGVLIELCETRDDQESLQSYATQFKEKGFSDYLFKWYMDKGERHKLMSQPVLQHENLAKFLSSHHHLSWLHDIQTKSFFKAHDTLKNLAERETASFSRKKTLLSLSKLTLLACEEEDRMQHSLDQMQWQAELDSIINEHNVILHQETLPVEVLQNSNLSPETMPPLSPTQLIELYVGDKNPHSSELDFKKALDLLQLSNGFHKEDGEALKRYIWCRAILKDNWLALRDADPLASARNTVFFKTVQLAYSQGLRLPDFMPSMESLLESEDLKRAGLLENPHFRYLLSAGYEQIKRSAEEDTNIIGE